jgi:predicted ATP-dependent protease
LKKLKIHCVHSIEEVLHLALQKDILVLDTSEPKNNLKNKKNKESHLHGI